MRFTKSIHSEVIQGARKNSARPTATAFGAKESVCSCTWVAAWRIATTSPTIIAMRRIGTASLNASIIAARNTSIISS